MRAHRTWAVLIGMVGIGCATAVSLDESGSASEYPDGGFGAGPDSSTSSAGGNQPVETGGYVTSYGGTQSTGGSGSGGRGSGGKAAGGSSAGGMAHGGGGSGAGGVSRGGSGGTLSSGGRASSGGAVASGGKMSSGGSPATGGASDAGNGCQSGEKKCGGVCSVPGPSNGCDLTSCTACPGPAPAGGVLACDKSNNTCSFVCLSGYTRNGSSCVSNSGSGGSTGAGGGGTGCGNCPDCGPINGQGCCTNNHCGCLTFWIPGTCH